MRRLATLVAGLVAAIALAAVGWGAGGGDDGGQPAYTLELDNAFGLVEGSDVKVAGVRAGTITAMRLDRRTKRALVDIRIDKTGFGSLRDDVRCTVRPQSLLGEYFIDCLPGRSSRVLGDHARIPVSRTSSTVPPDLVLNVMRLPYRERLRLVVSELGAGLAADGPRLNAAIRRAVPAIGQTRRVLRTLDDQRGALDDLVRDADTVTGALAANRRDVGRWVVEARDTASASAARRRELADGVRRLPGFLREIGPSMRSLGTLARHGTPSLQNLSASAPRIETLLDRATAVTKAARPAAGSLDAAARTGREAVRSAAPSVDLLRRFATGMPELTRDTALVAERLDNREEAVEAHPLSPGGQGFTALENLMAYIFNQVLAINVYDAENHILKGGVFVNDCSPFPSIEDAQETRKHCRSWAGPTQPGINAPDGSESQAQSGETRSRSHRARRRARAGRPAPAPSGAEGLGKLAPTPAPEDPPQAPRPPRPALPQLPELPPLPSTPVTPPPSRDTESLLDYLLGP